VQKHFKLSLIFISSILLQLPELMANETILDGKFLIISPAELNSPEIAIDESVKNVSMPEKSLSFSVNDKINAKFEGKDRNAFLLYNNKFDKAWDKYNWFDVYQGCDFSFLKDVTVLGFSEDKNLMFLKVVNVDTMQDFGNNVAQAAGEMVPGGGIAVNLFNAFIFAGQCEVNKEYTIVVDIKNSIFSNDIKFSNELADIAYYRKMNTEKFENRDSRFKRPKLAKGHKVVEINKENEKLNENIRNLIDKLKRYFLFDQYILEHSIDLESLFVKN
jgi:hypothetical protein